MVYFSADFNQFFRELAANNSKDWFDINRSRYLKSVKKPFEDFVQAVIEEFTKEHAEMKDIAPKDCIFRINRDIRFSADKTPYKTRVSAVVGLGGKKDYQGEALYFELGPEHVRFYAGLYELDKEQLYSVRELISADLNSFQKLYKDSEFTALFGEIKGDKNKIVPKEFREAATQEPLIINKQYYFYTEHSADLVESESLMKELLKAYRISRPVHRFLLKAMK